ncbi:hypothetical protein NA57DRAFT_38877 [Rhizodiscina lignyota]|uniref:Phytanoyl-CoA hydroxylase n=1 Tax=Rhizodiscina lignyota TaxID=1504668 RepID=A0A9P4M5X2_9PEZI|nr:hypothetical protein NA57DRAFT_38877 [Rhizodiscina lignyota]
MPHAIEEQLFANDGALEPSEIARLKPSDPSLPLNELRRRFQDDGYLFLKGLLPRKDVLQVREDYFKFLSPSGILKDGTAPVAGIFDSAKDVTLFPGIGVGRVDEQQGADFVSLALDAHSQDWYADKFCKHPVLLDFMARFTGWSTDTRRLERTLLRNNIPDTKAIGVHYDQIFLRYGEPTSVTVWVPMGDIKINGGGLMYLENGHALGKDFEEKFTLKAKASGLSDEEAKSAFNKNMLTSGVLTDGPAQFGRAHGQRWLVSNYEAGDVVLHSPYQIHASTVNHDPDHVIRLATDLRFVDSSRPWDQRWSHQFRVGDGV